MVWFNAYGLACLFGAAAIGMGVIMPAMGKAGNLDEPLGLLLVGGIAVAMDVGYRLVRHASRGPECMVKQEYGGHMCSIPMWAIGGLLFLGGVIQAGTTGGITSPALVGKWEGANGMGVMEFRSDGTVTTRTIDGGTIRAKYTVLGKGRVRVTDTDGSNGFDVLTYRIEGSRLTLINDEDGTRVDLYRR
jgi:hypothetical protein